ncbi:hypothetical protein Tco_0394258, partial [Tanacetum coccineum]
FIDVVNDLKTQGVIDLEAEDATMPAAPAPLSPDYVSTSPDYTSDSKSNFEPFKEDPQEEDPLHHNGPLLMLTLWKGVRSQFTLSSTIEVAIAEEIVAPPRKRARLSPSPPPPPVPSLPPLPLSSSLPSVMLLPRKRFQMTLPHTKAIEETTNEATTETTIPTRHCKKSRARIWTNLIPIFRI